MAMALSCGSSPPPLFGRPGQFGPDNYHGVPMFGLETQELTNDNMRKLFGLNQSVHGILVTKVFA